MNNAFSNASADILIIDDSPTIRSGLSRELTALGFTVMQAADGREGFDCAQQQHFDLIITDIDMPRINGLELCKKLKASPLTQSVPVIILSSRDADSDIEEGFKVGAAAFVSKYNARQELRRRIEEVLNKAFFLRERLVLIVDDSVLIRNIARDGLARAGFRVETAENGRQALAALAKQTPDLIISDVTMPEMDGLALCTAVRARPEWSSVPFVVMSTASERAVIRRMVERGACAFVEKPFNVEQLVITAEKLLSDQFQLLLKEKERLDAERNLMLGSITSLVQALEARDRYTRGHSEIVAQISVGMGKQMGFSEEELEKMHMAARLHDLGKIGVRDSILLKPGLLTSREFDFIKKHPVIGAEILGPIPSLAAIIPGVLYHHERMNGQGYPEGLSGDRIPLMARIIAVADTYDSLTSDRPYQTKLGRDTALEIIKTLASKDLCPDCVQTFLAWIEGKQEMRVQ